MSDDEIILHPAAQKLIEDTTFLKIVESKLKSIMMDGKIDKKDIPEIIVLVVYCTNNLKKFNLSYNQLGEVLEETIIYLLNHFDVIPEENKEEYENDQIPNEFESVLDFPTEFLKNNEVQN